jgi:hypothetical protein
MSSPYLNEVWLLNNETGEKFLILGKGESHTGQDLVSIDSV